MDTTTERALQRWRDAELLDDDQVTEIRAFERGRQDDDAAAPSPDDRAGDGGVEGPVDQAVAAVTPGEGRSSVLVEGLAYVGAALALGAGFALFGELWDDLASGARIALSGLGTAILAGAAWALRDRTEGALERLATVLSALAVVGVAATIGVTLFELSELDGEWIATLAGLGALVAGVPVHLARASWPTTLASGAALLVAVFGAEDLLGLLSGPIAPGITLMGIGLAWAAAGWSGLVRPRSAFEVTGLLAGGVGVQFLAFEDDLTIAALLVGLLVAGAAMAVGLGEDRTSPAVLGGLGITVFAPQLVFQLFGDTVGGPLALFVGGISLVTVAVTILRNREAA